MALLDTFLSSAIKRGTLTLTDHKGATRRFGSAAEGFPDVSIRLTDGRLVRDLALHPDLAAGEAYMDGRLVVDGDDILGLIELIGRNNPWDRPGYRHDGTVLRRALHEVRYKLDHYNWSRRAKRNVAHHYDLDDRLYDLFLDADRQYSCAYFTDPGNDLETAQRDKLAHITAKLALAPGQRVLDIGCGWGGMALYIHTKTGAEVLGITLSEEQLKVARRRADEAGVTGMVRFELTDYREVAGTFDRIVSVGMFEHVGPPHYRTFFRQCANRLADDGVMLLHTIGRMGGPGTTDAYTAKYIFPGGYCPALSEVAGASEDSGLIISDVEVLRLHYAQTLRHWYARTVAARAEIEALYDARFYRMWTFYLAGAAVSFETGSMCNFQVQYVRNRHALPVTRDYMTEAEAQLRASA